MLKETSKPLGSKSESQSNISLLSQKSEKSIQLGKALGVQLYY